VDAIRATEKGGNIEALDAVILGCVHYGPSEEEKKSMQFRRSLFVVEDIKEGEVFTDKNIRSIRPANGLPPKELPRLIGKHAVQAIARGTPLRQGMWI
jgi:N-acetylneuraminate synthase